MLSIQQVDDLHQVFEEHEHQFSESSKDLIVIDACDIIDSSVIVIDACDITGNSVIATIKTITDIRKSQFETFWKNFENNWKNESLRAKCRFYPLLLSGVDKKLLIQHGSQ